MHAPIKVALWRSLVLVLLGVFTMSATGCNNPGRLDFFFQKKKYQKIVDGIKANTLSPDPEKILTERFPDGNYVIQILTMDKKHLGFSGYLFHDKPRQPQDPAILPAHADGYKLTWLNPNWDAFYSTST